MLIRKIPCLRFSYLTENEAEKRIVGEIPLAYLIDQCGLKKPQGNETRFEVELVIQTLENVVDPIVRITGKLNEAVPGRT